MLELTNTISKYNKESVLSQGESKDCVVRACASAFNVTYDLAHAFVKEHFKREDGKGTRAVYSTLEKLGAALGHSIMPIGEEWVSYEVTGKWWLGKKPIKGYSKRRKCARGYTTGTFIKAFPKGTYFILVSRHTFTIIDGVVHGNPCDSIQLRVRIENAFEIKKL